MAKRKSQSSGVDAPVAAGKKTVFGEDDVSGTVALGELASSSKRVDQLDERSEINDSSTGSSTEQEDGDEDDAPEVVETAAVRRAVQREAKEASAAIRADKAEREVRRKARKAKALEGRGKIEPLPGQEEIPSKGNLSRVEVPSRFDEQSDESEDLNMEDAQSFHTDSDEEDDEPDLSGKNESDAAGSGNELSAGDHDENEDDEESLSEEDEASLDPGTRRLRARMQAAMESAEKQATGNVKLGKTGKNSAEPGSSTSRKSVDKGKKVAVAEAEDWSEFNMMPGVAPLPASVLENARVGEERRRKDVKRKAENDAEAKQKTKKRKKVRQEEDITSRVIDNRTTVALLPSAPTTALSPSNIPRTLKARRDIDARKGTATFLREAMKRSGEFTQATKPAASGKEAKSTAMSTGVGRVPAHLARARGSTVSAGQFRRKA